ncbi:transposase [Rhizobium sullae]|uniref:transposase n=1 Tax=Rhizobium sullae TaxID=50338 RepID=UPI001FD1E4FC|nr:transposase [Rhizobium sullae]
MSATARSEGLDPSQLYAWRRKALSSGTVAPLTQGPSKPDTFTRFEAVDSSVVEIVVGDVVVRAGGDRATRARTAKPIPIELAYLGFFNMPMGRI